MKREVAKWQNSPDMTSPLMTPKGDTAAVAGMLGLSLGEAATLSGEGSGHARNKSVDKIPLLSEDVPGGSTGIDAGARDVARERKIGDLPA